MIVLNRPTLQRGFTKGLQTTWELAIVMVPLAIVIRLLEASGALEIMARWFAPFMGWLGLPGEAALVLFSGYFINLYAAIGTMTAMNLSLEAMIILAVMLGFCHSMIIELAISKKAGCPVYFILPLRFLFSVASGLVLGGFLG